MTYDLPISVAKVPRIRIGFRSEIGKIDRNGTGLIGGVPFRDSDSILISSHIQYINLFQVPINRYYGSSTGKY